MEEREERRESMNFARNMKHSSLSPRAKKHSTAKLIALLAILIILLFLMIFAGCSRPNAEVECSKAERTAAQFLTSNVNRDYKTMRELSTPSLDSLIASAESETAKMSANARKMIAKVTENLKIQIDSSYSNPACDTITVLYSLKVKKSEKLNEACLKKAKVTLLRKKGDWKVDSME